MEAGLRHYQQLSPLPQHPQAETQLQCRGPYDAAPDTAVAPVFQLGAAREQLERDSVEVSDKRVRQQHEVAYDLRRQVPGSENAVIAFSPV